MRIKCPSCYAEFDLCAALDSDSGRELVLLLASQPREISVPLATYLSLFRSASRALSWDRALKLAQEVQALAAAQTAASGGQLGKIDSHLLSQALTKTVESLREKQAQGGWRPLSNHNYLKRTLENVQILPAQQNHGPASQRGAPPEQPNLPASKTGQAMIKLEGMKRANRRAY